jgi:ribosomal protein L18E
MSSRNFRLAKRRGFTNRFKVEYQPVNLDKLTDAAAGTTIDVAWLKSQRLVRGKDPRVKILGDGELTVALHFVGVKASGAARQKIESAGGSIADSADAATESAQQAAVAVADATPETVAEAPPVAAEPATATVAEPGRAAESAPPAATKARRTRRKAADVEQVAAEAEEPAPNAQAAAASGEAPEENTSDLPVASDEQPEEAEQ